MKLAARTPLEHSGKTSRSFDELFSINTVITKAIFLQRIFQGLDLRQALYNLEVLN